MAEQQFDVAVVGGGLAGCLAAITLAQHGHTVALFEAGRYPRAKVCGEFLSPETQALFEAAGVMPTINARRPVSINTARITAPDGTAWQTEFPAPAIGLSRYALDDILFQHAGALGVTTYESTRVTHVDGDLQHGFILEARDRNTTHEATARAVIVAHGKHSNLDKTLQRPTPRGQTYVGLKRHFNGAPLADRVDLHVFRGGYCGMSHVEDDATNVCLLVRQDVFRNAMQEEDAGLEGFIRWMVNQNPYLREWFATATPIYDDWISISRVTLDTKPLTAGDVLFAGDAAGMIAPLAGDGMAMALHSGTMAANTLNEYLRGEQSAATVVKTYHHDWQHTFANRLRLGRVLNNVMLRPALLARGLGFLNVVPRLGDFLVRQTRDLSLMERST
jgi:menaquinone-9 beta-reductase